MSLEAALALLADMSRSQAEYTLTSVLRWPLFVVLPLLLCVPLLRVFFYWTILYPYFLSPLRHLPGPKVRLSLGIFSSRNSAAGLSCHHPVVMCRFTSVQPENGTSSVLFLEHIADLGNRGNRMTFIYLDKLTSSCLRLGFLICFCSGHALILIAHSSDISGSAMRRP